MRVLRQWLIKVRAKLLELLKEARRSRKVASTQHALHRENRRGYIGHSRRLALLVHVFERRRLKQVIVHPAGIQLEIRAPRRLDSQHVGWRQRRIGAPRHTPTAQQQQQQPHASKRQGGGRKKVM